MLGANFSTPTPVRERNPMDNETTTTTETEAPEAIVTATEPMPTPKDVAERTEEPDAPADDGDDTEVEDQADEDDADDSEDSRPVDDKLLKQLRKKNGENKRLRERAMAAERKLLIRDVADEVGLPATLAERLQGNSREELLKDAAGFMEAMGLRGLIPGDLPRDGIRRGGRQSSADDETDLNAIGARMYER